MIKTCKHHGETKHSQYGKRWRCKQCLKEAVQRRRIKLKLMAVEYKGGACEECGYKRCVDALEFHHRDPSQKDFGIGRRGHTRSWEKIKAELDKCTMLCANCHREVHAAMRDRV